MTVSRKEYRVYSTKMQAFQTTQTFRGKWWEGLRAKSWNKIAAIIAKMEDDMFGIRFNYVSRAAQNQIQDFSKADDIEIVEYEVVLKELKRYSARELLEERARQRQIKKVMGYKILKIYQKMYAEGLDNFRYIIEFDNWAVFKKAQERLKELDIIHKRDYRFTSTTMIFTKAEDAAIIRLSFADDTSNVFDLISLKMLDIKGGYQKL